MYDNRNLDLVTTFHCQNAFGKQTQKKGKLVQKAASRKQLLFFVRYRTSPQFEFSTPHSETPRYFFHLTTDSPRLLQPLGALALITSFSFFL